MTLTDKMKQDIIDAHNRISDSKTPPVINGVNGPCPQCGCLMLKREYLFGYTNYFVCPRCSYKVSMMSWLGKKLTPVERIPDGALPVYDKPDRD